MKEPKGVDKRSKEYRAWKEWKANFDKQESEGLGDVVEKITKKTGIKKVVKKVFGNDCGCDKRKEILNKLPLRFPVVRCFTETQYNQWSEFRKKTSWTHKDQIEVLIPIFAQLFARQLKPMSCCLGQFIDEIDRVYKKYQ